MAIVSSRIRSAGLRFRDSFVSCNRSGQASATVRSLLVSGNRSIFNPLARYGSVATLLGAFIFISCNRFLVTLRVLCNRVLILLPCFLVIVRASAGPGEFLASRLSQQ